MGRRLGQSHGHPKPTEFTLRSDESRVIGGDEFKGDVMESRLEVDHADKLRPTELTPVATTVVQLILVFVRPLVDWDDILDNSVRLTGLLFRYKE